MADVLHEDQRSFAAQVSKTGVARYMTDLLASIEVDWVSLSRRQPDDLQSHVLYKSLMVALTRLALTESGWNTLAHLAIPEVLAQLRMFAQPPKQMFLQPASIKEQGSPAELFVTSFDTVIQLCCAICAKPKWKRLSFKLMRAEIKCRLMDTVVTLVQYVWDNDDATRPVIESNSMLSQLRALPHAAEPCQKAVRKPFSFVNPTLLSPQFAR
ncbi:unnamed protein product [Heligmosomoides polygyrus]|uniref:Mon2_C domain-containing protein n=1 Tax=Heligmosomoides polygyrus TaxID=6339 RepID=A0A183FSZ6_HELPZ|nr:unnamed protein product [Heligmosomoides polygyrus]